MQKMQTKYANATAVIDTFDRFLDGIKKVSCSQLPVSKPLPPKIQKEAEQFFKIDAKAIEHQIHEAMELQTVVEILDSEIAEYQKCYCARTGRFLHELPFNILQSVMRVHDRRRQIIALQAYHTSQIAPDWMITDDTALAQLLKLDPVGYAIYSIGILQQPYQTAIKLDSWQRYKFTKLARINGDALYNSNPACIHELNEYLKRLLAVINPTYLSPNKLSMLTAISSAAVLQDAIMVENYISEIANTLFAVIKKNFNEYGKITTGCIGNIKARYHGVQSYSRQQKISSLTEVESIMFDLRNFMDGKSPDLIELAVGTKAKPKPQTVFIQKTANLALKVSAENAKEKLAGSNPFAKALKKPF